MVKIRLKRMGMKKKPFYRIVPVANPAEIRVDAEKAKKWIANGAQPTDTVRVLLKKAGATD